MVTVINEVDLRDEKFDQLIKSSSLMYYFRYDFEWEKSEVLQINELGRYRMRIEEDKLMLTQKDGYILTFHKKETE
ncbi:MULTISPECIES: hypothetical protein [unclassified Myroides]|uniref:hypothetical protein n=1 Tax=unclassified Myroides TaxID=2642485 RepID=UPI003D2F92E9